MTKDLNKLTDQDLLNIVLYGIYLLSRDPQYSALGELIYTLDKDNFYKLCSEFGGTVIRIPTLDELRSSMKTLLIYQEVNSNNMSFIDACKKYEVDMNEKKYIYEMYNILSDIIEAKYE